MLNFTFQKVWLGSLSVILIGAILAHGKTLQNQLPLVADNTGLHSKTIVSRANEEDLLLTQLAKNKYALTFGNGKLKGAGADFLFKEAQAAQFFLIAENHGFAELPQFTGALFREINRYGYNHFAIETGPLTARLLASLAKKQSPDAFAEFNRQNPFSIPFFSWKEEADLLNHVINKSDEKSVELWGLDQEFILSAKINLQRLLELTADKQARLLINEYYQNAKTEFNRAVEDKNPGILFMYSVKEDDFKKMEAAIKPKPGSEAAEILNELKISREIYAKQRGRGYESNLQRSELMKAHFMRYYEKAVKRNKSLPKVLFKFGANHMKRGRNYTNVHDIGNLAAELANANQTKSFHLFVAAAGGTQNSYFPFGGSEEAKVKKYDGVKAFKDFAGFDITLLLTPAPENKDWVVLDLKPLRPLLYSRKLGKIEKATEELIWGYDAVLIIPDVHAAKLF